jgi:hypothetical protein
MAEIRTLKLNLLADVDQFQRGLKSAKGDVDSFGYKLGTFSKGAVLALGKVAAAAIAAASVFAAKIGIDSVKAAGDLGESINKTEVIFGQAAKSIVAFSKTTATALGLSQKAALDAAATFATFGKASGLTGSNLTQFSEKLVRLSADLASFYNTSPEQAITAIGAALRGESEPIRQFGVLLNDATLKAEAMKMGLYDGTGALDQQARVMAAYQVILNQTKDAQGDFARTSDGLANQQRQLSAGFENLKTSIGVALLPIMLDLVNFANEKLIPILKNVADGFSGTNPYEGTGLSAKVYAVAIGLDNPQDAKGYSLGQSLRRVTEAFGNLIKALLSPDAKSGLSTLDSIAISLSKIATAIDKITTAWNTFKSVAGVTGSNSFGLIDKLTAYNPYLGFAGGGLVSAGVPVTVGEMGKETFIPNTSGRIVPNSQLGGGTTIIMNGVIDAESARRSIEKLLQDSARRTGAINLVGATL